MTKNALIQRTVRQTSLLESTILLQKERIIQSRLPFHKLFAFTEIAAALTEQGIKSPKGKDFWRAATIRGILRNEKYCGDALMQKTCTIDFREHKSVKNTMLNKYFKEEHHTAIIKKSDWQKVQQILDEKPLPGKSARLHAMPKRFTVTRSKDKYFRGYIILDPRWTASERRELLKELKTL